MMAKREDSSQDSPSTANHESDRRREDWQQRLLPLMATILVGSAVFFAVMSVTELRDFYGRVEQKPLALGASFAQFEEHAEESAKRDVAYLHFKIAALLEADALHRRYHQATATMLARVWTRQLGFLTGMLLAVVGAAFILGRLHEDPMRLEGEGHGVKAVLATSSPGLVLSTLGTLLMAITLIVPFGVETRDSATYIDPRAGTARMPAPGWLGPLIHDDPGPAPTLPEGRPSDPDTVPKTGSVNQ